MTPSEASPRRATVLGVVGGGDPARPGASDPLDRADRARRPPDRRAAEEELRATIDLVPASDHERRSLLETLTDAQEAERARVAAELQDDAMQAMTVVGLRLDVLIRGLDDDATRAELATLSASVSHAISRLRRTLLELQPPHLDDGLVPALRTYLAHQGGDSMLRWEVRADAGLEPGQRTRAELFRIASQVLGNARRDARARTVEVSVGRSPEGFRVRIADDGITRNDDAPEAGSALTAMRERAELSGGHVAVEPRHGRGTITEIVLPDLDA